ncbi:MAG: DUF493 domain-containing protein [Gammaproteobacteria bacterium]|nr:DUF493 domain-containing protein [Gammaproteobacteria bacterium]MDH4254430.1 DUF493 domain-containing protein [Gammaproteobacteria bacterium]MDH5311091.1 DUF493 domain-containing protein [Gammaproteobacteria bacterium]
MSGDGDNADRSSAIEFPCSFPIKMMGRDEPGFRATAISIIEKHAGTVSESDIREARSSKGNFVSITITINAVSQGQLDDIYRALTDHEQVLFAL